MTYTVTFTQSISTGTKQLLVVATYKIKKEGYLLKS